MVHALQCFVSGRTAILPNIQRVECPHAVRSVDSRCRPKGNRAGWRADPPGPRRQECVCSCCTGSGCGAPLDGYDATRQIKALPGLGTIPIIAVSSFAMKGDEEKARASGCDDYLTKPYSPVDLLRLVRRYFGETAQR
jgi:hypothetical protein